VFEESVDVSVESVSVADPESIVEPEPDGEVIEESSIRCWLVDEPEEDGVVVVEDFLVVVDEPEPIVEEEPEPILLLEPDPIDVEPEPAGEEVLLEVCASTEPLTSAAATVRIKNFFI
jgi:hypothetical protein